MNQLLKDKRVLLDAIPLHYEAQFSVYTLVNTLPDAVVAFAYTLEEMKAMITKHDSTLVDEGVLYMAYPKLKNSIGVIGIHRDALFPYLNVDETSGYVNQSLMRFNKMLSLDQDFTLLCIKKDKAVKKRREVSQRQSDYEAYVSTILSVLKDKPCLAFYNSLTKGYKVSWARYVYSAVHETTRQKRIDVMIAYLDKGIKSKDLGMLEGE